MNKKRIISLLAVIMITVFVTVVGCTNKDITTSNIDTVDATELENDDTAPTADTTIDEVEEPAEDIQPIVEEVISEPEIDLVNDVDLGEPTYDDTIEATAEAENNSETSIDNDTNTSSDMTNYDYSEDNEYAETYQQEQAVQDQHIIDSLGNAGYDVVPADSIFDFDTSQGFVPDESMYTGSTSEILAGRELH